MNDRQNKTSIFSIIFLDIIDYSKKTDSEQIEVKNQFNALINQALKDIAVNDRIILDTGDGAAIACDGSPEDALFISLTIRDEIIKNNIHTATPLYVRFGINLGPVRVVKDINGRPNIIGDGINVAQRIMSFAKPNQILVSRSYYEVTSRLTQEISQMFDYSGVKHDKHVREHEIYSVRLLKEQVERGANVSDMSDNILPIRPTAASGKVNWKYALLAAPAAIGLVLLVKLASQPLATIEDRAASAQTALPPTVSTNTLEVKPSELAITNNKDMLLPNESIETVASAASLPAVKADKKTNIAAVKKTPEQLTDIALANKEAKIKVNKNSEEAAQQTSTKPQQDGVAQDKAQHKDAQHKEVKTVAVESQKATTQEKSGWDTFKASVKQGGENKCTQAQIAMSQCN